MDLKTFQQIQVKDLKYFIDGKTEARPVSPEGKVLNRPIQPEDTVLALVGRQTKPAGLKGIHALLFPKAMFTAEQAGRFLEEHRKEAESTARHEEKFFTADIKEANDADSSFWATASTSAPDRVGDIIHAEGWDLKNFKKNPVIQPFHDYQALPVAKAVDIYVRDNTLRFKPKFAVDIPKYDLPGIMYGLYRGGFMNAFSVGFDPIKWAFTDPDNWFSGIEYFEQELLEISAVPVPCHPGALIDPAYQRMMKAWGQPALKAQITVPAMPARKEGPADPDQAPAPATPEPAEAPGGPLGGADTPAPAPEPAVDPAQSPESAPGQAPATPDLTPEPAQEPGIQAPASPAEDPPAPDKGVFMPMLNIKSADDLYELASILKSGRVLSDRNRQKIKSAIKELARTAEALTALLKLTEAKAPVTGGDGKGDPTVTEALKGLTGNTK